MVLNGIWAPFYTQHKILAGLMDAYSLCRNEKALEVAKNFALWVGTVTEGLSDSLVQSMLHCEHGGINESLAELYGITGEGVDRQTAEFFWDRVVNHHSYVTGGHGNDECFGPPDRLARRLSSGTTETCNVYNMLKLTRHLFGWEATPEVADFYERALFNQILSSQHPEDGRVIYNLSLEMGGYKEYQDPMSFTCCMGTGMENGKGKRVKDGPMYVPVLISEDRDPNLWLETSDNQVNTFATTGVGHPRDIKLMPFYRTHDRRYSVYWDLFSSGEWDTRQEEYRAKQEKE